MNIYRKADMIVRFLHEAESGMHGSGTDMYETEKASRESDFRSCDARKAMLRKKT